MLKYIVSFIAKLAFFFTIDLLLNKNKIIVLMYHGVSAENVPKSVVENYDGKQVFVKKFERQLRYLLNRYHLLTLDEFCDFVSKKKKLPENSLLLTFDDGYLNNYEVLFPVLKKYGVPATVFICPGLIGKNNPNWPDMLEWAVVACEKKELHFDYAGKNYLFSLNSPAQKKSAIIEMKKILITIPSPKRKIIVTELIKSLDVRKGYSFNYQLMDWEQIKKMQSLVCFGSHSLTHPILPVESVETVNKELIQSKKIIEKTLKRPVRAFAYPNGIYDENVKRAAANAGYGCAFTVGWGKVTSSSDTFSLRRIPVSGNDSLSIFFLNLIFDVHKVLHMLRGFWK